MALVHSPQIITDGLVLALDAANRKSYSGTGTAWTDLSGIGNNGTLTNGPTYNSSNGGTFIFDGSNDYVQTSSNIFNITLNWTVDVWFKTSGSINIASLVVRGSSGEGIQFRCELDASTGRVRFLMRNPSDQSVIGTTSTNGTGWHMATYVNNANLVSVYLDGRLENSATITNLGNIAFNVVLGRLGDSTGNYYFNGNIGIVRIYNRALTAAEIQQNFNAHRGRFGI